MAAYAISCGPASDLLRDRRDCPIEPGAESFRSHLQLANMCLQTDVSPCRCLHFSNSRGLFFSCSNADATASALGMSGSAATEKHVDSERGEITGTILASTRKCVPPAVM